MNIETVDQAHTASSRWVEQLVRLASFIENLHGDPADLQEVRDLIVTIETFRTDHLARAGSQALDVETREELARLRFQVETTITAKLGVRFENRDRQMNMLVSNEGHKDGLSSFWLIDAPARYGKTFFIFEAHRQLQEMDWNICYFSLKEYLGSAQDKKTFLTSFRRTFDKSFLPPWPDPTVDLLLPKLVGDLGNQDCHLAIFIDDAELVTEKSMVWWIKDFLAKVKDAHKGTGKRFVGLVSGRYISPNWYEVNQVAPFPFDRIPLGSLGYRYTLEMIGKISRHFNNPGIGGNMAAKELSARIVQMIGAGCPECTINLLIDIGLLTSFNPAHDFFDEKRRKELFEQHARPICAEVLEDISDSFTREYFPYLCILRRHNRHLLRDLIVFLQTSLPQPPGGQISPEQIEEILNRTGLIGYDPDRAFQGDDNIRQLLGLQMWLFDREQAEKINNWAMRYFQKQIRARKNPNGIGYNREAFIEFLYHYALKLRGSRLKKYQAVEAFSRAVEEEYARLENAVLQRIDPYEWTSQRNHLVRTLLGDVEIRDQLAHFGIDETEYAALCKLPDERRR